MPDSSQPDQTLSLPSDSNVNAAEMKTIPPRAVPPSGSADEMKTVAPSAAVPPTNPGVTVQFESSGTQRHLPGANYPTLDGYEILGELGRGGMGVVYKVRYLSLDRIVALKMILSGGHASLADLARFKAEALAVSRLQHPNIVQIFATGEQDGRPFFSLEFCGGGSLEGKLKGQPQPPREAAALIQTLALAMQAAHERGIVHRDLKPANVLLSPKSETRNPKTETEAVSDFGSRFSDFELKITDFGLAKRIEDSRSSGQTASGTIMGTPSYMAPEQAAGQVHEIGPAADVYALAAILYELLTGRPPFRADTMMTTVLQVIHDEPIPPSRLQLRVPRDLETICLKSLEKSQAKRYASARDLADDLGRYLAGEPILARPVSTLGRLAKWARRRPAVAALSALVLSVAAVGFGLVTWQWIEAEAARRKAETLATSEAAARQTAEEREKTEAEARRQAEEAKQQARDEQARAERMSARLAFQRGSALCEEKDQKHIASGLVMLAHSLDLASRSGATELEPVIRSNLAGWSAQIHTLRQRFSHPLPVVSMKVLGNGDVVATSCVDGKIRLWDTHSGTETVVLSNDKPIRALAASPDGRTLLAGSTDGKVWFIDVATRKSVPAPGHKNSKKPNVRAAVFSRDGKVAATGDSAGHLQFWDVTDGKPTQRGSQDTTAEVRTLDLNQDGKVLAAALADGVVEIYDTTAKTNARVSFFKHGALIEALVLHPDGKSVLTGGRDKAARLWDAAKGTLRARFVHNHAQVVSVAFHPKDDTTILTSSWDGTAQQWTIPKDAAAGMPKVPRPMERRRDRP